MALIDSIIGAESGGDPNAKNPNSSATGAGQFINSTWLDTITKHRPDLAEGKSPEEILALRSDPALSKEMTAAYAGDNAGILSKAGVPVTPGNTYLAHFAGPQGAIGLLNADPSTPAGAILGPAVVKANPFLANMTAADVAAWANRKVGGAPLSMAGPPQPTQAAAQPSMVQPQPGPPLSLAPPQARVAPQQAMQATPQQTIPQAAPQGFDAPLAPFLMPRPRINLAQHYAQKRGF